MAKSKQSQLSAKSKGTPAPQGPKRQRIAVMGPTGKIRFQWRDLA